MSVICDPVLMSVNYDNYDIIFLLMKRNKGYCFKLAYKISVLPNGTIF